MNRNEAGPGNCPGPVSFRTPRRHFSGRGDFRLVMAPDFGDSIEWLNVGRVAAEVDRDPGPRRTDDPSKERTRKDSREGGIMSKNIYVGNLPYDTTGDDLVELFQTYGAVTSGQVIIDKFSGRSRGFGFVEMANDEEAQAAIDALNGTPYGGRPLTVNEARPREERGGGRGG